MKEQFRQYVINLYQNIPTEVYEGLLSIFCLGVIGLVAFFGWRRGWKKVAGLLLAEYVFLLYCSTVICRKVSEGVVGHNFSPFWSYEAIKNGREDLIAENIMNVVAFMPIGALLCGAFQSMTWWKAALIAGGLSISVEVMQFVYRLGFAEVDDVMHNIIGCVLGYMLVKGSWLMVKDF